MAAIARRTSPSLRSAQELHFDLESLTVPDIPLVYTTTNSWCDEILSRVDEPVYVSTSEYSMLHTVMKNGMDYNPRSVMEYVFTRWESIISRLIEQGVCTLQRYDALITRTRQNITTLKTALYTNIEDSVDTITRSTGIANHIAELLNRLGETLDRRTFVNRVLTGLSSTKCITKTPLFVQGLGDEEYPTLQHLWPSLYQEECDRNSLDDRKIFIRPGRSSLWNLRNTMDTCRYSSVSIPSGFGFRGLLHITRSGHYPSTIGKTRSQVGFLLSALDSVATHLFSSSREYFNWTRSIGCEILEVAGPRPLPPTPPPPPMPSINADIISVKGPVAEDDVDPVTLETFKEGDQVFQMRCCRNKLLQTSIRGILDSGRRAQCPLCRTALLV